MKEEKRTLELLSEALQKQGQTQADVREMKEDTGQMKGVMVQMVENQSPHQQILKVPPTNMQKTQAAPGDILEIFDPISRMQRDQSCRLDRLENLDMAA